MAWIELTSRRTLRNKVFQDGNKIAIDATLAPLHYESLLDSGVYDTEVNATPVQVNNSALNGWIINQNGWHYALGRPKSGVFNGVDGVVGFGGRQGAHWFKFRLVRVGYGKASTREWGDLSGAPTYSRANLSNETRSITFDTTGAQQPIESVARWADLWPALPAGQVDISWRVNGDQLKEEIAITQAAREWIVANRPPSYFFPGTPLNDVYFGFVFRLDWSDIPRIYRAGILKSIEEDYADDGEPIEIRDALDRLLAFMPLDDVIVRDVEGNETRQPLRKRFYKDTDNNYYLLAGVRCDVLAALPAGDLIFDPTIDSQIGASANDGEWGDSSAYSNSNAYERLGNISGELFSGWNRFTGITIAGGSEITSAYIELKSRGNYSTADPVMRIYAEDADNPSAPSDRADAIGRARTTAYAAWTMAAWTNNDWFGSTIDISSVVQELVDTYTISNDAIQIFVDCQSATGFRSASTYDDASIDAPKMHIEYTEGGGGTQYDQPVAGAITPSGTIVNRAGKVLAGAVTPAGVVLARAGKTLAGALTPDGGLVKRAGKVLAGALEPSGIVAAVKTALISLGGALEPAGALVRRTGKALTGAITPDGGLVRSARKVLAGAITPDGALSRMTGKVLAGELTPSGIVATIKAALMSLAGELAPAGALVKRAGKALAGAITPDGGLVKRVSKSLARAITPDGGLVKRTGKTLAGATTPSGTLSRLIGKIVAGAITPAGDLVRSTLKSLAGELTSAGELVTQFIGGGTLYLQSVAGSLEPAGALVKQVGKSLTGALTPVGVVAKRVSISLAGELIAAGALVATMGVVYSYYTFSLFILRGFAWDAEIRQEQAFDMAIRQEESD